MTNNKPATTDIPEQFIELKILLPKIRQSISYQLVTECVLGSDSINDLVIEDATISAKHARIFVSGMLDVFIEPIADAVVALNGL